MELQHLAYVRAVVQAGSVTRAAESLNVGQPSVSKAIRTLEQGLGVPLFHRVGRRLLPTEAGALLAECAGRVLDDIAATTDALADVATSARGALRLCATETVADELLPPAIASLRGHFPNVFLSVEMTGTDDAIARVLADAVDLAFVPLPLADSRLEIRELGEDEIVLVLPRGHPLAARERAPLADALREPTLLLSMPGHGLRAQIEQEAQAHGVSLGGTVELRSQRALLNLVACGAGVTFAPWLSARAATGPLLSRRLTPRIARRLGWVTRKGRHVPPVALLLADLVREALELSNRGLTKR